MHQDKFYSLLDKIFNLMTENKLREDIDDTLLEKLISVIKSETSNEGFIADLLKNTQVLYLCEEVLTALLKKNKKISPSITVFSLRLLGFLFQNENSFIALKNLPVTLALSDIACCNIFVAHSPSTLDAVIACLMSVMKHATGALWLTEHKFIDFVFTSFSSSSYYVKKTAGNFFSELLCLWSTAEHFERLQQYERNVLNSAMENIISTLVSGILHSGDSPNRSFSNCCIGILKQVCKRRAEALKHDSGLLENISDYFKNLSKCDKVNQDVIDLLIAVLQSHSSKMSFVRIIIQQLVKQQVFAAAFQLVSSFLSSCEESGTLSSKSLCFLLMPLNALSGQCEEEEFFHLPTRTVYSSITKEMEVKSSGVLVISSSLIALTKLTPLMNAEAIAAVFSSLKSALEPVSENVHFLAFSCLENRSLCLSLLELFSSFLSNKVYSNIGIHYQQMLFEFLMLFLEKPTTDTNIVSEALCLLKKTVSLNAEHKVLLEKSAVDKFMKLLCRKLFSNKDSIVDSALHLAGEIICDQSAWSDAILKEAIHTDDMIMIIYDIAVEGFHDGVIKASALKAITEACLQPHYFNHIKSKKGIDEVDIMKILCNYVQDPDFFIQREAISCVYKWINSKAQLLPDSCKDNLFLILSSAIQSLDLDLKLIALDQWKWCIENDAFFPPLCQTAINSSLATYCASGFSASLMYAIEDYDEAVKYKAATMMRDIRDKLLQHGIDKDFIPAAETKVEKHLESVVTCDSSVVKVSREERNEGIDNVMNQTTAEQLLSICKISDFPDQFSYVNCISSPLHVEPLSCSVASFWSFLWSKNIDNILCTNEVTASVFSDYTLSLLDDIIAAERNEITLNDTPDCY